MILYESSSAILCFDSSIPCLELIIKQGFRNKKEFKESHRISIEKYIELKPQYPDLGFFLDARDLLELKKQDIEWLGKKFFPRMEEAGLTKKAFLFLDSLAGKTVMEMYKESLSGSKITLSEFNSYKAAKAWLKEASYSLPEVDPLCKKEKKDSELKSN